MPDPRLLAIVTALVLMGSGAPGRAAFSLDQLKMIEQLILSRDTLALGRYLAANPRLTQGDDPLSRELLSFQHCMSSGRLDCFASQRTVAAASQPATTRSVY
ncbi:hypothetical protein OU426_04480 [Frigidibacter sp. RF13]|uniref:hypothetical protein n=1 Tax=Frigidibacter sp. RF13 TaxID=2997340 RepID=UPI002270D4AB|nr:hypothetical protein [Frigidibacter sp. RF13]MCY1126102.1 hypothetical protein [Frigidibacter sp. RF13]